MISVLVEMEFDRFTRLLPGLNETEAFVAEQRVVRSKSSEEGRSLRWNSDGKHGAVNDSDKAGACAGTIFQRKGQGRHSAGREADHSRAIWIDVPFCGSRTNQLEGGFGVVNRKRLEDGWSAFGPCIQYAAHARANGLVETGNVARSWIEASIFKTKAAMPRLANSRAAIRPSVSMASAM